MRDPGEILGRGRITGGDRRLCTGMKPSCQAPSESPGVARRALRRLSGGRSAARDGMGNRAELFVTTRFKPAWSGIHANPRLRRTANRVLISRAVGKMDPRPDPLSTLVPYGGVDRIEFYVGLVAGDARRNSLLPALMGRKVGIDAFSQALTKPLLAPRVFNAQTFSPLACDFIRTTRTLSDVLNRNVPAPTTSP